MLLNVNLITINLIKTSDKLLSKFILVSFYGEKHKGCWGIWGKSPKLNGKLNMMVS